MLSPLGKKTIKHVTEKLVSGESAGLSEIVKLIQKLSSNAYETTVHDLGSLIGKDVVVTAKVIMAANTIGYNPTGVEVSTISQAIHVIGFNKIRQLTVSLLLVESVNRNLNPDEKREIAALALCSGLMAESIMTRRGSAAPDHAFICASLRSYGRLLMTAFMIEEYRRARIMITTGLSEDESFNRVFGLTPLELGYHLLSCAHLPEPILKSLRAVPPGLIRNIAEKPELELIALADLSVRVCELALRADVGAREFERQTVMLALRYGKTFDLDAEALVELLRETGQQLSDFTRAFGFKALSDQFSPRINARVRGNNPPGFKAAANRSTPDDLAADEDEVETEEFVSAEDEDTHSTPTLEPSSNASAPGASAVELPSSGGAPEIEVAPPAIESATSGAGVPEVFQRAFQDGIEQVAALLDDDPVDMQKVLDVVLAASLVGFSSDQGILFVRDASGRKFIPGQGSGPLFNAIRSTAAVREDDRNAFGLCLQRMEDILIYDATDPKVEAHLPPWIRSNKLASFVLLPMHENRRPFALLLVGWREKKTVGFTVTQIRQVRSMLKLAGTARKLSESRR